MSKKFKGPTEEQIAKARKQYEEFEALIASLPMSDAIANAPTVGVDENGEELIIWQVDNLIPDKWVDVQMTRRYAVREEYCAAKRAEIEAKKVKLPSCSYCHLEFDDEYDAESICTNAMDANACWHHPSRRPKFKLEAIGPDFVPIEDDPMRLEALQDLINDGAAWHRDIDQDGCIGRQANDLIARKILKAPRSYEAKRMRHYFDVAQRFGIDHKTNEFINPKDRT
jgi:hypothetical protein